MVSPGYVGDGSGTNAVVEELKKVSESIDVLRYFDIERLKCIEDYLNPVLYRLAKATSFFDYVGEKDPVTPEEVRLYIPELILQFQDLEAAKKRAEDEGRKAHAEDFEWGICLTYLMLTFFWLRSMTKTNEIPLALKEAIWKRHYEVHRNKSEKAETSRKLFNRLKTSGPEGAVAFS